MCFDKYLFWPQWKTSTTISNAMHLFPEMLCSSVTTYFLCPKFAPGGIWNLEVGARQSLTPRSIFCPLYSTRPLLCYEEISFFMSHQAGFPSLIHAVPILCVISLWVTTTPQRLTASGLLIGLTSVHGLLSLSRQYSSLLGGHRNWPTVLSPS